MVMEQFWFLAVVMIKEATLDTTAQRYINTHMCECKGPPFTSFFASSCDTMIILNKFKNKSKLALKPLRDFPPPTGHTKFTCAHNRKEST